MNIGINKENIFILLMFLFSIFFSISYSFEQKAIDGALAYSGLVKFPEGFSVMKANYFNQWTLLHQLPSFLLKLDFSIVNISRLLLLTSTIFYMSGIYLISKSISKSTWLAFLIAITVLMYRKNFGDVGYPTLIFSRHTFGMMSLSVVTFIFGLIANRNLFFAGFFSTFLICIHPVIGCWITFIIIFAIIFTKYFKKEYLIDKKFIYGLCVGVIPVFISFIFYYNNIQNYELGSSITQLDQDAYTTYISAWDSHRTNWGSLSYLNYDYLAKTLLLIMLSLLFIRNYTKDDSKSPLLMFLILLISCFFSISIYITFNFFPNYFPEIVKNIIPSRLILTHSVIGWPIIICVIFLTLRSQLHKLKINKIYSIILFSVVLVFYSVSHYENIQTRVESFTNNFNKDSRKYEDNTFWKNFNKIKLKGYILTASSERYSDVYRYSKKPILLDLEIINVIPYIPYIADEIKNIIEKVYGVPFNNPPVKFVPCIPERIIKRNFEKKNYDEWIKLSKEFNFNWIVIPSSWNINLDAEFKNSNYAFYDINDLHSILPTQSWITDEKKSLKIKPILNNCYPH